MVCVHPPTARRPSGRSFTGDGRSTRSSTQSTPPPESMRGYGNSGSTRSPPARTRSARPRSCSRLTESSDPARECRLTSLTLPAAHTCARFRTRYGAGEFRRGANGGYPDALGRSRHPRRGRTEIEHDWPAELPAAGLPACLRR
jgi:hypothetical protein